MEDPLAALLLGFDLLPTRANAAGGLRLGLAEDVRVAADELGVYPARDRLEITFVLFLQQQREELDLEEKVAELVQQLRGFAPRSRVGDLVRLLDRVRHDRERSLFPIPRTVTAQPPCQLLQFNERLGERQAATRSRWWRSSRWRRGAD